MYKNKEYAYWLHCIPHIGKAGITALLDYFGSPQAIYESAEKNYKNLINDKQIASIIKSKTEWDLEKKYEELLSNHINFINIEETEYPERLKEIPDSPYGIFWKGKLPQNDIISVAIVGARECSEYGKYIAKELGKVLGEKGIQVISGMARGIDGISQASALAVGGTSYAVLGCGVDICYPAQNKEVYKALLQGGGIISSYPPGTQPQATLFPPRNRIISGLSDVVVVIEARQKSGTLITVDMALEQGREVYVVPGRLTDRLSDGCNKLLKHGAGVFLSPEDFLGELEQLFLTKTATVKDNIPKKIIHPSELSIEEEKVLSCLDFSPQSVETIHQLLSQEFTYTQTIQYLIQMCIIGKAKQIGNGYFCLT